AIIYPLPLSPLIISSIDTFIDVKTLNGTYIYFIPDKLGIKIKFRFKFLIAVIAMITIIISLGIVGLME
ncbi:hypothetical protein ACQKFJ_18490, partial [Bacillus mycoides]